MVLLKSAASVLHDENAARGVVTDAVGGVAEQPAPQFRVVAAAHHNFGKNAAGKWDGMHNVWNGTPAGEWCSEDHG